MMNWQDKDEEENVIIPENGDKILFAEDLITHIMNREFSEREEVYTVAEFRDFLYNAFNDTMSEAIDYLLGQYCMKSYDIPEGAIISRDIFMRLVVILRNRYFVKGFDPKRFLYYCVQVGSFAVFCRKFSFIGAPLLGARCITDVLDSYNMSTGGWDVLNNVAAEYSKMYWEYRTEESKTGMNDEYTSKHLKNPSFLCDVSEWKFNIFNELNSANI